jgi:uncharacterized membrane protein
MKKRFLWLSSLLVLAALAAALMFYEQVPERIPTHWNLRGEIDGDGSRLALLLPVAMMLGLMALWSVLPALSPKRFSVDAFQATYWQLGVIVIGMIAWLHGVLLWAALDGGVRADRAMVAGLAIFLGLIGNLMGKVRRNFWIGIRTPWTLANERVWYATHRLAAKSMVATAVFALLAIVAGLAPMIGIVLLVAGIAIPLVYSLLYYKRLERGGQLEA